MSAATPVLVVAGSYEKLLYGWSVDPAKPSALKPVFIFPAHHSCIKAVAASPGGAKWLATGSTDEVIKVWDLRRRKELGGLVQHDGSITYLDFPTRSHLVSASDDGTICLFRARDWTLLRTLKGHKGRVNGVAMHPSTKVALSVGVDRTLRMWDMMRGKGSASIKLAKEAEKIQWSPSGNRFAVLSHDTLDIYATDLTLKASVKHAVRFHSLRFFRRPNEDEELVAVAAEDKATYIYRVHDTSVILIAKLTGHTNRVKAIDVHATIAVTASSDGVVRVFDLASLPTSPAVAEPLLIEPITSYDTKGTRLTCVCFGDTTPPPAPTAATGKRKRETDDLGDQGSDSGSGGGDDSDADSGSASDSGSGSEH